MLNRSAGVVANNSAKTHRTPNYILIWGIGVEGKANSIDVVRESNYGRVNPEAPVSALITTTGYLVW